MLRNLGFVISFALILLLNTIASVWAAEFGTEEEGKPKLCFREQWPQLNRTKRRR
jgi:hypothetical protein